MKGLVMLLVISLMAGCAASAVQMDQPNTDSSVITTTASYEALVDQAIGQFTADKAASFTIHPPSMGQVFVGAAGDDGNPGTLAAPVRTIRKAMVLATATGTTMVQVKILGDEYPVTLSDRMGDGMILNTKKIVVIAPAGTARVRIYPETAPTSWQENMFRFLAIHGFLVINKVIVDELYLSLMVNDEGDQSVSGLALINSAVGAPGREMHTGDQYFYCPGMVGVNAANLGHKVYLVQNELYVPIVLNHGTAPVLQVFGYGAGEVRVIDNQFKFPSTATAVEKGIDGNWEFPILTGIRAQGAGIEISQNQFESDDYQPVSSWMVQGILVERSGYPNGGDGVLMDQNDFGELQGLPVVITSVGVTATAEFRN
jgi:hypothetical protein